MEVQVFDFESSAKIRTVEVDGKTWFVGSDIAKALGYTNPRKALSDHCKSAGVTKRYMKAATGMRQYLLINESNIYRLIAKSKLESAERFESWVFDEVLPQIRKTGSYLAQPKALLATYTKRILSQPIKNLPKDYWTIFDKSHSVMLWIEANIGSVNEYDLADASIGKRWSAFRKGQPWAVQDAQCTYHFDDGRGDRTIHCYHRSERDHFEDWLHDEYMPKHLDQYLESKFAKDPIMLQRVESAFPRQINA